MISMGSLKAAWKPEVEPKALPKYGHRMSLTEILSEIPKLSFAERQELVRAAIEFDEQITAEESALLDERLERFHSDPSAGIPLAEVEGRIKQRLQTR